MLDSLGCVAIEASLVDAVERRIATLWPQLTERQRRLLLGVSTAQACTGADLLTVLLAIELIAHASLPITLHELPGYGAVVISVQPS